METPICLMMKGLKPDIWCPQIHGLPRIPLTYPQHCWAGSEKSYDMKSNPYIDS